MHCRPNSAYSYFYYLSNAFRKFFEAKFFYKSIFYIKFKFIKEIYENYLNESCFKEAINIILTHSLIKSEFF